MSGHGNLSREQAPRRPLACFWGPHHVLTVRVSPLPSATVSSAEKCDDTNDVEPPSPLSVAQAGNRRGNTHCCCCRFLPEACDSQTETRRTLAADKASTSFHPSLAAPRRWLSMEVRKCSAAPAHGHLSVLQWARENGCVWDERTCSAAPGGHPDARTWARDIGCP